MVAPIRALIHRYWRDQTGAVAIEFVFIAPILFALLFGIITLGYFMGVSHSVQQLATGAARASVAGLDKIERESLAAAYLAQASERYPLLIANGVTPTVTYETTEPAGINIEVSYSVDGTLLEIANGFLGLGITTLQGRAYLAY